MELGLRLSRGFSEANTAGASEIEHFSSREVFVNMHARESARKNQKIIAVPPIVGGPSTTT